MAGGLLLRLVPYFDPTLRYSLDAPPTLVNKPTNLSASIGASGITLAWADNAINESGFIIERSSLSATEGFWGIGGVVPNGITFRDSLITSGETYYYRINHLIQKMFILMWLRQMLGFGIANHNMLWLAILVKILMILS